MVQSKEVFKIWIFIGITLVFFMRLKCSNEKKKNMYTNILTLPMNSNKFLKACEENLVAQKLVLHY